MDRAEVRLLTLVGPPGIGKTRLSQEVARRVLDDFPDGVFFVALAALHDPGLIASTMAQALGLHVAGEVSPLACLTDELSRRRMLLLLDNFEHLVAGADVVAELLAAAPDLKVVATSREALHLYGEHVFPVPPLAVPDETRLADVREEDAAGYPSVQLFVERARAANPHF
ncbi:MAG: LuxR family transcriptional regulator, partial [Chloroflexi bacterium]